MMLHHLGVPERAISSVKFSCFNASEIRDLSAKRVTNPHSLDALLNPTEGGLYDAAYGASTRDEVCSTCGQGSVRCPGHMGHIELPLPVYHPLFFKTLFSLLRGSCLKCQKLLIPRKKMLLLALQLEALENGLVQTVYALKEAENELKAGSAHGYGDESVAALELQSHLEDVLAKHYAKLSKNNTSSFKEASDNPASNGWSRNAFDLQLELVKEFVHLLGKAVSRCPHCGASAMSVRSEHNSRIYVLEVQEKTGKVQESTMKYMTPSEVRTHFAQLWENEKAVLSRIFVAMADAAVGSKLDDSAERADKEPSSSNPRSSAVDVLFLNLLPVPPSRFRPIGCVNGKHFESPQTTAYSKVLMDCTVIRALLKKLSEEGMTAHLEEEEEDVTKMGQLRVKMANKNMDLFSSLPGKTLPEKMENAWHRLQQHVNSLFDSELDRLTVAGAEKCPGIKQLLEKKDGLFRKHMMGKRVNYAARSVISPDPYIATNEIGLPLVFATRLTYPTPVTPWNVQKLRKAVINGPKIYPGATHVVSGGRTILLSESNRAQREAVAKQLIATDDLAVDDGKHLDMGPKIVKRHIQTGDVMLLNRQPTLHKGSIMAHKVRVLPGEKTLRLHYANCKSYNADFDGDEMNAHFPQSELGRSEAYQLMSTDKQYLSGKDGKPLSCLIQDHMVAGVSMAIRGRFFKRDEYQQLLYNALMHLPHRIKLMKPSILKPQPLWSGKQVYSTILINVIPDGLPLLNLVGKSKIGRKEWQNRPSRIPEVGFIEPGDMCESQVIIRSAELLCGVLDKAHYGATEYGLVHATYELYGGEISGRLLTCLARLFTAFLQHYRGFTLGVEDILVTKDADLGRTDVIERTKEDGMETVAKTLNVKHKSDAVEVTDALWDAHVSSKLPTSQGEDKLAAVDHAMKKVSNSVNDQIAKWCTAKGLLKTFPRNNLQLMVISGAKGGAVNCMQISCLLGQIELEGRRPPLMPSGRSVPSFQAYSTDLRAGGFISQRFLTGIRPQEYFYHCMAGREGLVDTAVKTSRSGYLQRCLIKHLEGLLLSYDMTVRDSDGSVLQFLYGEDGIDIAKSSYLRQKQCDFVVDNFRAMEKQLPLMEDVSSVIDVRSALKKMKKFDKIRKKRDKKLRRYDGRPPRTSEFLEFSKQNEDKDTVELFRMWNELAKDQRECYASKLSQLKLPDPVISVCRPDRYFGSISERFYDETKEYLSLNPANLSKEETRQRSALSLDRVETLMKLRYQRSLCQPGESVGLLAAQSIGEPSTQMTLNTFHFAGRGEMNVTLGIPRLREILMVASRQIKTPQITVPVLDNRHNRAKRLCKELTKVMLSQVLHKFTLEERLVVGCGENGQRHRRCVLEMHLLPEKQFKKDFALTRDFVLRHIENRFLRSYLFAVTKRMKLRASEGLVIEQRVARESARKGTSLDQTSRDEENGENSLMNNEADGSNPARGDDDDDDVDEEAGFDDGDAGAEALRRKRKDDVDYEEQDDGIVEENDEDATERVEHMVEASDSVENQNDDQVASSEVQQKADLLDIEMRIETVKRMSFGEVSVEDYEFDEKDSGWCKVTLLMPLTSVHIDLVSLVREEAASSPVRAVRGISRCILVPAQGQAVTDAGAINLVTDGINFYKIFENEDSLDVNRLYCNCIHSVASVYGIEAARRVIVTEIANVFAVYGIEVDPRHLSLVGDYMCFEGVYKPFNRAGIESCVSPLQQMSFETTMKFVNSAALHGLSDSLQSPSARIVAGQVVRGGTGTFSLVYPVAKCN